MQISKRAVTGTPITPQVRSLRKVNSDQVAIAIDMDPSSTRLDDEDDDKGISYTPPSFIFYFMFWLLVK